MRWSIGFALAVLVGVGAARVHAQKPQGTAKPAAKPAASASQVKPVATVESAAISMDAKQSAQVLALWKTHANSSGSVPLARPL